MGRTPAWAAAPWDRKRRFSLPCKPAWEGKPAPWEGQSLVGLPWKPFWEGRLLPGLGGADGRPYACLTSLPAQRRLLPGRGKAFKLALRASLGRFAVPRARPLLAGNRATAAKKGPCLAALHSQRLCPIGQRRLQLGSKPAVLEHTSLAAARKLRDQPPRAKLNGARPQVSSCAALCCARATALDRSLQACPASEGNPKP